MSEAFDPDPSLAPEPAASPGRAGRETGAGGRLRITFLGVGEAFDEAQANTCLLVESPEVTLLLDCGFTAVARVWEILPDPEALDAVYLSHTHADHLFGLPGLLVRYAEEGRQKPLTILGRPGLADHVKRVVDFAYPGIAAKLTYQLRFGVLDPAATGRPEGTATLNADESEAVIGDLWLRVAPTQHSIPAMALRVEWSGLVTDWRYQGRDPASAASHGASPATAAALSIASSSPGPATSSSLCYSGDGMWTDESAKLYQNCDLLVHECYLEEGETKGHCSLEAAIELYNKAQPKRMALVHLRRTLRPRRRELLRSFEDEGLAIEVPEAGNILEI